MALASEEHPDPEQLYQSDRVADPTSPECEPEPTHHVGDLVDDKYELLELLGQGGMSHVWRARDYVLNIDVALKIIRPRNSFPGALERLLCEARAAVSISHPSIVMSSPVHRMKIPLELFIGASSGVPPPSPGPAPPGSAPPGSAPPGSAMFARRPLVRQSTARMSR